MLKRDSAADAGAGRRAIDFTIREDAYVADVNAFMARWSINYRPVEKAEVLFEWMLDLD